jgi:predicted pyridoxine 5'-phosphate oxidase superfamily flavin-nucleotide-binding protein
MPANESPFHRGEKELQPRLGIRGKMEQADRRMIRDHMPQQHREFFSQLPLLLVGTAAALIARSENWGDILQWTWWTA